MNTQSNQEARLKRVLGVPSLVIFALAYMVPLGVFTTYGLGTELTDGHLPAAYVLITAALLLTAFSYGQMARLYPVAGSAYTYARQAFGQKLGFLSGWTLLADYLLLPLVNYLVIGLYMGEQFPSVPTWIWIVASIVITTVLNVIGIKLVTGVNLALCAAQGLFLVVFIVLAAKLIVGGDVPSLLSPFMSADLPTGGLFEAAAVIAFTFLGFDAISALSEDAKEPRRTVPRAILLTVLIGGVLTTVTTYFSQLVLPDWTKFENADTAALDVFQLVGGDVMNSIFIAAYVAGCLASAMSSQASSARILFAMGRDGVLSKKWFGRLHPNFQTPVFPIVLLGVASGAALFVNLITVVSVLSFGALFAYVVVNLAVIKCYLLDAADGASRSVVKHGLVPALGAAFTLWLWTSLSSTAFVVGLSWAALGLAYLLYITRFFTRPVPDLNLSEVDETPEDAGVGAPA